MKPLKTNVYLKVSVIIVIGLLLLIPAAMIRDLIMERENTQKEAIAEVSSKWAGEQTISGPILSVPYKRWVREMSGKDSSSKIVEIKEYIHFLPTTLKIDGKIIPQHRNRGIYEIVVYNSRVNISGNFSAVKFSDTGIPAEKIDFGKAMVILGLNDLRGIEKQVILNWNNESVRFNPGTLGHEFLQSGINASVDIAAADSLSYSFSLDLELKGSQRLYFIPAGETTDIKIESPWPDPSFNGAFLPDDKEVTSSGFVANWNIIHLNRNFPQQWTGRTYNPDSSAFGIDLLLPVDNYQKSMRSIKYAILFIGFTFIVFFFVEILNKVFIHPVQYIMVGIALIVFYTLLISVSEYWGFNPSFLVSALATLLLVTLYVKAILGSKALALLTGGILLILYTFIFVIIQLQDYALLIGSIGIFIILALVMYFSRKIDWYNISMGEG